MNTRDKLVRGSVVRFSLSDGNRTVEARECCDDFFSVRLDKAGFGRLIDELRLLHDKMDEIGGKT